MAREQWVDADCPRPAEPPKYLPHSDSLTGFVYTVSPVAKERNGRGQFKDRTFRGLFAIKEPSSQRTYVIATTGQILSLEGSGEVQLLRPR